jgi:short-subunit dehydrogenase
VNAHALVVGASSGIGLAVARRLRHDGFQVSGLARRAAPVDAAHRSFGCDLSDPAGGGVEEAIAAAVAALGEPEVLCYCAGHAALGATLAVPTEAARRSFEINFWGLDRCVRAVLPRMSARRKGSIVAVLSLAALRAIPHETYYAAAKAAADRYLGCLAHEAARDNVSIKTVYPGYVPTGFFERAGWHGMERPAVSGSGVSPEDVAKAVARLVEGAASRAVVGWRERAIVLGDRLLPGAYDRLLKRRSR